MNPLKILYQEFVSFFGGLGDWWRLILSGDYKSLLTVEGLINILGPIIPVLVIIELSRALIFKKFKVEDYKVPFLIYVVNRLISRFISIATVSFCIGLFEKYATHKTSFTWYWFIYAYFVWELAHYIYHYLGHKVRLFWCLHSTHHAPQHMNLTVNYAHFFLETPYADAIRTSICILLGVHPALLIFIMVIDGVWGGFIHVGENLLKDGRLGFLQKFILTPSHHRVHHARNPLYMDTNFCNLINIWDRLTGTLQHEQKEIPPEYGITREMNPNSFLDVYFGEFVALFRDLIKAPGIKNKFLYTIMPPGWSHTGDHKTAKRVREEFLNTSNIPSNEMIKEIKDKEIHPAIKITSAVNAPGIH